MFWTCKGIINTLPNPCNPVQSPLTGFKLQDQELPVVVEIVLSISQAIRLFIWETILPIHFTVKHSKSIGTSVPNYNCAGYARPSGDLTLPAVSGFNPGRTNQSWEALHSRTQRSARRRWSQPDLTDPRSFPSAAPSSRDKGALTVNEVLSCHCCNGQGDGTAAWLFYTLNNLQTFKYLNEYIAVNRPAQKFIQGQGRNESAKLTPKILIFNVPLLSIKLLILRFCYQSTYIK